MKALCISFLLIAFTTPAICQEDGVADTIDIYVINNTNRFVALPAEANTKYAFFYRDLKSLRTINELKFQNVTEVTKFFDTCEKALETGQLYVTQGYNISRNRLSKNVVRLNNKEGGYTLLKYATLEHMRKAFDKRTK